MKSFQLSRRGPDLLGLGVSGRRYWWRMGRKIALLLAHASLLTSFLLLPLTLGAIGGLGNGFALGMMAAMVFVFLPLSWVFGVVWNGLLGLILLPCVYLVQRLIAEPIRRDTTGWIAGSAVAIVGSAGGLMQMGAVQGSTATLPAGFVWMLAIQVFAGLLGIAAAQAGGYLGSISALRRRRRLPAGSGAFRFTVWRLMAVTAILSALLCLLRLTGDLATPLIVSIVVSSFVAWAIHRPVAWATNRWLDWRLARRRTKRSEARSLRERSVARATAD